MIYIGKGKFYPDIPARELSKEEVEKYGGKEFLEETGLYEVAKKKKQAEKVEEGDE